MMKKFKVTSFCSEPERTPTGMLTSPSLSLTVKCGEINPISASDNHKIANNIKAW